MHELPTAGIGHDDAVRKKIDAAVAKRKVVDDVMLSPCRNGRPDPETSRCLDTLRKQGYGIPAVL